MRYKVTMEHHVNGKVHVTKSLTITANNEDIAKKEALDLAGSIQTGMFKTMIEGNHSLKIVGVEPLE